MHDLSAWELDVACEAAETAEVPRCRLSNGEPVVLQTDCAMPRVGVRAAHAPCLRDLGETERYEAKHGKHSDLDKFGDFRDETLVKVAVKASVETVGCCLGMITGCA